MTSHSTPSLFDRAPEPPSSAAGPTSAPLSVTDTLFVDFPFDDLSPAEKRLLGVILEHQGKDNAISVPSAASAAQLNERSAQAVCKRLVEVYGLPIASSSTVGTHGWYLCTSPAELEQAYAALRNRALSILTRARAFKPSRNERLDSTYFRQLRLALERPELRRAGGDHG